MRIEINPGGGREAFLRSLNQCFPGWGDINKFAWYFEPRGQASPPDLLAVWSGTRLVAGTGLTYRTLRGPDDELRPAAILTGSWTDPEFRGQGLFARLVETSRERALARGCRHLLAFVRQGNPSLRVLLRTGARAVPTFYLRGRSEGPLEGHTVSSPPSAPQLAELIWSRFRTRTAKRFGFDYPDAARFREQFLARHSPTAELLDGRGSLAVVQNEDRVTNVLFVDSGDDDPASAVYLLRALEGYARQQERTLMLFTTEDRWRAAGNAAGLTESRGTLVVLPDGPGLDAAWTVFGGDRA